MEVPRLKIPPRLHEQMAYGKFAGGTPRMLILKSEYWLDSACLDAAHELGWDVEHASVVMEGLMPREHIAHLLQTIVTFRPDFILSINLSGMDVDGIFAQLFGDLGIPYVVWFVDDPRTIVMDRPVYASPFSVALTWEAAYEPYLRNVGFPVVSCVPLAVDRTLFNAEPADTWPIPPTFVGNSMTNPAEYEWAWVRDQAQRRSPMLLDSLQAALASGCVTRERFAEGLAGLLPPDLFESLDEDERRHAEIVFFVEGTRRLRRELVLGLQPEGLCVRGDEGWREILSEAGGPVNYRLELPAFYRSCEINLNVTSIQMATTVNQRVFDCPAAGGFLITDAQSALETLFDVKREVVRYHSTEECVELLRWFRSRPAARREIAAAARRRILGEHTYAHRLKQIERLLRDTFATG